MLLPSWSMKFFEDFGFEIYRRRVGDYVRWISYHTKTKAFHRRNEERQILKGLKLPTLDKGVIGDIKRLARLSYSIHEKTERQCVPVNLEGNPLTIETIAPYRESGLETKLLETICKELAAKKRWEEIRAKRRKTYKFDKASRTARPCIEVALSLPLHKGEGHKMRLGVAVEHLCKGFSMDEVVDLFRSQVDFNESKTRYFVTDAQRKGYKPFKCSTIKELGFCLGESCSIFKRRRKS